jgi:nitrile hydratase subunit beta
MNGVHDLGGMDNFGPILVEENEPVFHEDWERTIYALTIGLLPAGYCNIDEVRRTTENIEPTVYLQAKYYQKWLLTLESILIEKDVLTQEEIDQGKSIRTEGGDNRPAAPKEMLQFAMTKPLPANVDIEVEAKFTVGDQIVAKNMHPLHHTRIPRYIRGKRGVIIQHHGVFLLADTNAYAGPDKPQNVYSVQFSARELWGDEANAKDTVCIDLHDDYMDPISN